MMIKRKVVWIFVFLIVVHLFHVIEEVIGNAVFIEQSYNGVSNFLIINFSLILIPLILLYFTILKKKIAYYLSFIYGVVMIIDGLDHVIRNYAGFYTGILLIILGFVLIFYLFKEVKNMKGGVKWQRN